MYIYICMYSVYVYNVYVYNVYNVYVYIYTCHASCSVYIVGIFTANCGPLHTHLPWLGPAWSTSGSAGPAASKRDGLEFS